MAKPTRSDPIVDEAGLRVKANPEISRGAYANLAIVRHTPLEFILDFVLAVDSDAQLVSRIILSPDHAKRLAAALQRNIEQHAANVK